MAIKIYFASCKGGAGTTTCTVGVGLALARRGERVLVVDGDEHYPAALTIAGCAGLQTYTLEEARKGACRVKQAVIEHPRSPNFFILPCAGCEDRKYIAAAVTEVESLFDYVLCDSAAPQVCERAAVVCEPYPTGIKGADICLNHLRDMKYKDVGVIVNKVNGGLIYDNRIMPPKDIAALLHAPLLGVIPEDLGMALGTMRADSVKAVKMTAARIAGDGKKIYQTTRTYLGAGGFIKRKMRGKI